MGIASLLPNLRSITSKAHVSKYVGQTAVVDAYCLLHRGAHACARELVEGEPTDRRGRAAVFDGDRLPAKAEEERSRERSRQEAVAKARALWLQGNRTAAHECYQRAAYLVLNGLADVVITEDSDLLAYGCPRVFFKMDRGGDGEEVALADLPAARELGMANMPHALFQEMCVMAGCDFCASLPGVGVKKAHAAVKRSRCFVRAVRALRFAGTPVPDGYLARFQRALWTFRHQRVFCPRRRRVVTLTEVPGGDLAADARVPEAAALAEGEADFLGPPVPDEVACAVAAGDLDPITKRPFAEQAGPGSQPSSNGGQPERPSGGALVQQLIDGGGRAAARPFRAPRPAAESAGASAGSSGHSQEEGSSAESAGRPAPRRVGGLRAPSLKPAAAAAAAPAPEPRPPVVCRVPGLKQRPKQSGPSTSRFFAWQPQPLQASGPASLLAKLKAAAHQPTLEDLLAAERQAQQQQQQQQQPLMQSAELSVESAGAAGEEQPEAEVLPAGLRLQRSPTIDELLDRRRAGSSSNEGASLLVPAPAARRWQPQLVAAGPAPAAAAPAAAAADVLRSPLDLTAFGLGGGKKTPGPRITPGFYEACSETEEEEEQALLRSLPPGEPLASPGAAPMSPRDEAPQQRARLDALRLQLCPPSEARGAARQGSTGAEEAADAEPAPELRREAVGGAGLTPAVGDTSVSAEEAAEAISSLAHLPACAAEAEQAVDRALEAACRDALAAPLQQLAPLPGLRRRLEGGGGGAAKRARAAVVASPPTCQQQAQQERSGGKENRSNPFASFTCRPR
eukprot:scaffold14.g1047.t1